MTASRRIRQAEYDRLIAERDRADDDLSAAPIFPLTFYEAAAGIGLVVLIFSGLMGWGL